MDTLEDRIRRRAYELWEKAGRHGHPEDHWYRAEREVRSGEASGAGSAASDEAPAAPSGGSPSEDRSTATLENANPAEAVAAVEFVMEDQPVEPKRRKPAAPRAAGKPAPTRRPRRPPSARPNE
jgi:hypothetical protein